MKATFSIAEFHDMGQTFKFLIFIMTTNLYEMSIQISVVLLTDKPESITSVFLSMLFEYPYKLTVAYCHRKKIYLPSVMLKGYHFLVPAYSLR